METIEITLTQRADDFHACLSGVPEIWGRGASESEAIGDMVWAHPEAFKILILKVNPNKT